MSATSEVPGPERLSMMWVCRRGVLNSRMLFTLQVRGKSGGFSRPIEVLQWQTMMREWAGGELSLQLSNSPSIPHWAWMETSELHNCLYQTVASSSEPWSKTAASSFYYCIIVRPAQVFRFCTHVHVRDTKERKIIWQKYKFSSFTKLKVGEWRFWNRKINK